MISGWYVSLQERLNKVKATYDAKISVIQDSIDVTTLKIQSIRETLNELAEAIEVFSKLAELSRQDTILKVENLVSFALQTIFDDSTYKFAIQSKEQKNGVLYDFTIQRYNLSPVVISDSVGGGVCDIISTFLGIIIPILLNPNARRLFALDERFKHVSPEHSIRIAKTLQFFAVKLNCQFIISTHNKQLIKAGDIVYRFRNPNGTTIVEDITNSVISPDADDIFSLDVNGGLDDGTV